MPRYALVSIGDSVSCSDCLYRLRHGSLAGCPDARASFLGSKPVMSLTAISPVACQQTEYIVVQVYGTHLRAPPGKSIVTMARCSDAGGVQVIEAASVFQSSQSSPRLCGPDHLQPSTACEQARGPACPAITPSLTSLHSAATTNPIIQSVHTVAADIIELDDPARGVTRPVLIQPVLGVRFRKGAVQKTTPRRNMDPLHS